MIAVEPSTNEILQVAELARAFIDTEDQNMAIDEPISEAERAVVQKVHDWAEALESLSKDDVIEFALAVLAIHNKSHQIEPCLTISTSHIDIGTVVELNNGEKFGLVMYDKGDYGWWFYVADLPEDIAKTAPSSLFGALALAQSMNCVWLCLDQGADVHPSLETYEW